MAHFDGRLEDSSGNMVDIRVPSLQGGTDREIYKNGNATGYRLGDSNNEIYTTSGRHVSDLSLKEFVKQFLGYESCFYKALFYC
ncbi:MAG: hypothetical protein PHR68_03630 [Candidatus Gracilibacteria bacterium]|nr:hypothetical protein [Candidatus Gracilibacteria bacterium]